MYQVNYEYVKITRKVTWFNYKISVGDIYRFYNFKDNQTLAAPCVSNMKILLMIQILLGNTSGKITLTVWKWKGNNVIVVYLDSI